MKNVTKLAMWTALLPITLVSLGQAQACSPALSTSNRTAIEDFVASAAHDDALGDRAPAALRERGEKYMSERYLQHHPGVASGREAFVQYHIKWYHDHPPRKRASPPPPVAVLADCEWVLYAHRIYRPDLQRQGRSYESVLFDLWKVRDGKADEHWDSFVDLWHQQAVGSNDPEAEAAAPPGALEKPAMSRASSPSADPERCDGATIEHNRSLIARLAVIRADPARLPRIADQLIASDYIEHNPYLLDRPYQGRAGFVHTMQNEGHRVPGVEFRYGMPEFVLADCTHVGTVKKLLRADPAASGMTYESFWFDLWRVEGGQLKEHWDATLKGVDYHWEDLDALNRVQGAVPVSRPSGTRP